MIIIIGGGIAGLSLGWQLVQRGGAITVLEQKTIGSGASHAAAAYLEPRRGTGAMRDLEWAAVKLWRDFAARVEITSGMLIDYRHGGLIRIAYDETHGKVKHDHEQRVQDGWRSEWLDISDLRELEPNLSDDVTAGAYLPDIDWCDGRKLCKALAKGIVNNGGTVTENAKITSLEFQNDETGQVNLETGDTLVAEKIVLCTGMGSTNIRGLPNDIPSPRPVKGVMLALDMDPDKPLINRLIKRPDGIMCPRSDGRLLVGVTHEDGATSTHVSNEDIARLLNSAARAAPKVRDLPLREAAVGIRSLVGDGTLRLGRSHEAPNLYYSLSHAGAGFLRAPAISKELADFILSDDAACPHIENFLVR